MPSSCYRFYKMIIILRKFSWLENDLTRKWKLKMFRNHFCDWWAISHHIEWETRKKRETNSHCNSSRNWSPQDDIIHDRLRVKVSLINMGTVIRQFIRSIEWECTFVWLITTRNFTIFSKLTNETLVSLECTRIIFNTIWFNAFLKKEN